MSVANLSSAKEQWLAPLGIDDCFLQQSLVLLNERKIDFGDIFFERTVSQSLSLEDNIVNNGGYSITNGVGIRALIGEKTGFAYSDVINQSAVSEACKAARSISAGHNCDAKIELKSQHLQPLYVPTDPIHAVDEKQKIAILQHMNEVARSSDPRVKEVIAHLRMFHRMFLVANTDGTISADIKPTVSVVANVILQSGLRSELGFAAVGGAFLLDELTRDDYYLKAVRDAIHAADVNLQAIEAPSGTMPVVLGSGWAGVIIHEAVGHGLEADANYNKLSVFHDKIGQKVASSACSIIDDGTIPNRRGSQSCDDEGTPTAHNVLIENGVLKGYMHDKRSALLMNAKPTGNGRRASYDSRPIPRMTNTYLKAGEYTKEEVIESLERGIYAVNFHGGQVDVTSGRFVFDASEAYLVEKGKLVAPIRGASIIGNGLETMQKISMVANDLALDGGYGACGKQGQSVAVGIGQPTIRVDELTVGGTCAQ